MYGDKRLEKKKTTVKRRSLNPVFNESFMFNIPFERLRDISVIIHVMDYDKLSANDCLGHISLGTRSTGYELKHWKEMLASPRRPVAKWHMIHT